MEVELGSHVPELSIAEGSADCEAKMRDTQVKVSTKRVDGRRWALRSPGQGEVAIRIRSIVEVWYPVAV